MAGTYKSIDALLSGISNDIGKAMNVVEAKSEPVMYQNVGGYYTGQPQKYVRTGALANTPRSSGVSGGGGTWKLELYLEDSYSYNTGTWTMAQVMDAAEHGALVGSGGFWNQSEEDIIRIVDETFSQFFGK